jgi:periplasmic divalent cation tolerance protein
MENGHGVVVTTVASREDAREIADKVLAAGLAACVQLIAIDSLYTWNGEVADEPEVLLLIKTREALYPELESAILAVHRYETPEVIMLPVLRGLPAYLSWIDEVAASGPRRPAP